MGERTAAEIENELLGAEAGNDNEEGLDLSGEGDDLPDPKIAAAESEAGRKGWVPKALYKGDPKKWVDASTFLERGERFNKNLQRELESVKQELESFKGTAKKFAEFQQKQLEAKDVEIKDALAALRRQKAQATVEGDADAIVEIEDRMELLKDEQKAHATAVSEAEQEGKKPENAVADPVLDEWVEDGNTWFKDEPKMRDYAVALGIKMRDQGVPVNGREFLDKVSEAMRRDFPRYFRVKGQRSGASAIDSGDTGNGGGEGSGNYSERDLPAVDRQLMRDFVAQGLTTKEKFLKNYFSDAPRRHS